MKKLLILVALVIAGLGAGFLWIRSWLTPEYLRQQVEVQAKNYYTGTFSIGEIAYQFPLSIRLDKVLVADPAGKDKYLEVEYAAANLEPWGLLSKQFHVTSFVLSRPSILVALDAKNQLEMMRHVNLPQGGESSSAPAVALTVSELRIEGAKVTLRSPGQPLRKVDPLDARLALLGETLTLHSLEVKALETVQFHAQGKLTKLLSAPSFENLECQVDASMPSGILDPKVHGTVGGAVKLAGTLAGPATDPTGDFRLTSQGLSWQAPDQALTPIKTGPLDAKVKLIKQSLEIPSLELGLWEGKITGKGRLALAGTAFDLTIQNVVAGTWLGPMLADRGFGAPLPQLTVNAKGMHLDAASVALEGVEVHAGGLKVAGNIALAPRKQDGAMGFAPRSALTGTFAGPDTVSALQIPNLNLEGEIGIQMTLSGPTLGPTVKGKLDAPSLKVGRPKVFSLPVKDLTGSFSYDGGALDVPDLKANLVGGSLNASAGAKLDAIPPSYRFRLQGAEFKVPEIFQTALVGSPFSQGALDLNFDMSGQGTDPKALKGKGSAAIRMAQIASNPTLQMLATQLKSPEIANPTLDGKFKLVEVEDGRFKLGDFSGDNGKLGPVTGTGSVGFDQTVDAKVAWQVPLDSPGIPKELQGKTLPVSLTLGGTISAPVVKVDDIQKALGKMLENEAKARLEAEKAKALAKVEAKATEKVGALADKLLSKFGGGSPDPAAAAGDGTAATPAATPDAKEQLKEKAKGLLKGLFR